MTECNPHQTYLWKKLGHVIQQGLADHRIKEIACNPNGELWFDDIEHGWLRKGVLSVSASEQFVHAVAADQHQCLTRQTPYLDGVLPFQGERIHITIPPVSEGISFNIRKPTQTTFTLTDYLADGMLTPAQFNSLQESIRQRKNIVVSGSPACGKTTLANAILETMSTVLPTGHRVLMLEQVPELRCAMAHQKRLLTTDAQSMRTLLWLAMRHSPDAIVVGEVRDGAALDLLKAWNTGCRGGLATIHANSAPAAIQRLLDLAMEVVVNPPYTLAVEALEVMVHLQADRAHPAGRRVSEIIEVIDFNRATEQWITKKLA